MMKQFLIFFFFLPLTIQAMNSHGSPRGNRKNDQLAYLKRVKGIQQRFISEADTSLVLQTNDFIRHAVRVTSAPQDTKNLDEWAKVLSISADGASTIFKEFPYFFNALQQMAATLRLCKDQKSLVTELQKLSSDFDSHLPKIDPTFITHEDFVALGKSPECISQLVNLPYATDIKKQLLKRVINHQKYLKLADVILESDTNLANEPLMHLKRNEERFMTHCIISHDFLKLADESQESDNPPATLFHPLHYNCLQPWSRFQVYMTARLISHHAHVNAATAFGVTPLMLVSGKNEDLIVKALLSSGAHCRLPNNNTLLHYYLNDMLAN